MNQSTSAPQSARNTMMSQASVRHENQPNSATLSLESIEMLVVRPEACCGKDSPVSHVIGKTESKEHEATSTSKGQDAFSFPLFHGNLQLTTLITFNYLTAVAVNEYPRSKRIFLRYSAGSRPAFPNRRELQGHTVTRIHHDA